MPTKFEGELLLYNRKVTRSGGDGLGLTSSCKSWLRHHLAMVPFALSFRLKHSILIFTVQLSYILVLPKIPTIKYTLAVTTWKCTGSEHRNTEERKWYESENCCTEHAQQHAVSSFYVR